MLPVDQITQLGKLFEIKREDDLLNTESHLLSSLTFLNE